MIKIHSFISYMMKYKKLVIASALLLVLFALSFHEGFYQQTIVKVTKVENTYESQREGVNGQVENSYLQEITAVVRNGEQKGNTITFSNEYSASETLTTEYRKGDRLFVELKGEGSATQQVVVLYPKRDSYLFLFAGIFLLLLLFLFRKKGFLTLLSTGINVAFFFFMLQFFETDAFYHWMWIGELAFFIIVTLLFVSGVHRKTFGAILSTIGTVALVAVLYAVTIYTDKSIAYEMQPNYVPHIPLDQVFFISTVIGILGAVMDIAVTINASVSELVAATPNISLSQVYRSIVVIGHDTMGTMVNVLFFSYLSGSFPLFVLKFSNNYSLTAIISNDYIFDLIRFLTGSIGIVLAIPISGVIAVLLWRKDMVKGK